MTTQLIHPIEAATPTQTWLEAAIYLAQQENRTLFNLILGVREPTTLTAEDFCVHDVVNDFLEAHDKQPLVTTAGTIFPGGLYLQGGAKAVYSEFPALYKKFRGQWGTYAGRMLCRTIVSHGRECSPLEALIEKLKAQSDQGHMRAAYEMKIYDDTETCDISTYEPTTDCNMTIGQPCLTHLSFKLLQDRSVSLTALYRTHFYIEKTLGNLLGLGQLLSFVAEEAGLTVGTLVCHSTMAQLDVAASKDGSKGWNHADVDILLKQCRRQYVTSEPAVSVIQ
jgi:hypothetical protein